MRSYEEALASYSQIQASLQIQESIDDESEAGHPNTLSTLPGVQAARNETEPDAAAAAPIAAALAVVASATTASAAAASAAAASAAAAPACSDGPEPTLDSITLELEATLAEEKPCGAIQLRGYPVEDLPERGEASSETEVARIAAASDTPRQSAVKWLYTESAALRI